MCIYGKMQKNKKYPKTQRLRACENSETVFADAKLGYCSVDIIAEPQEICKYFLEFFQKGLLLSCGIGVGLCFLKLFGNDFLYILCLPEDRRA